MHSSFFNMELHFFLLFLNNFSKFYFSNFLLSCCCCTVLSINWHTFSINILYFKLYLYFAILFSSTKNNKKYWFFLPFFMLASFMYAIAIFNKCIYFNFLNHIFFSRKKNISLFFFRLFFMHTNSFNLFRFYQNKFKRFFGSIQLFSSLIWGWKNSGVK